MAVKYGAPTGPKPKPPGPAGLPSFPGMPSGGSVPGGNIGPGYPGPGVPGTGGGFGAGMPPGFPGAPGSMPGTGGGFGAGLPGPPGTPGGPMSNDVTPSANLTWLENQYKSRLTNDPTQRAIDRSTSSIRDATSGLSKELGGNLARRGVSQAGLATNARGDLAQNAQQQIARASSDISLGRERDLDQMTMGGLGIMGAQDQLGLSKQRLGLDQWSAQNQAEIARQQLGLQSQQIAQQGQQSLMDMWGKYVSMFR